jgi:hypothetical protein
MADNPLIDAGGLAARECADVHFRSGNAELEGISFAQDSAAFFGGNEQAVHRDAVVEIPRPYLRDEHDEGVPGKSSTEGPARVLRCHRDDLMNGRPHFTPSPGRLEETNSDSQNAQPTTLATVKPSRDMRIKVPAVAEIREDR